MPSSFSLHGGRFEWVLLTVVLAGCGSDSSGSGRVGAAASDGSSPVGSACAEEQFILGGTLGGQAVSHQGTVKSHAWMQLGTTNSLDATFDPTASLHAVWPSPVAEGQTTSITGSVTLPSGIPHGGETLNSNAGSLTKMGDEIRFEYTDLSTAVACIQAPCPGDPVSGSLQGCLHWKHIGP